jgi:hypothetical protein
MAIREVLTSFTFEQQRLMINLIGTDVGDTSTLLTPTNVVVPAINEIVNGDVDLINQTHGMDPGSLASPSLYWGTNQGFFLVDANKIGLSTGLAIAGNLEVDGDITFRAGAGAGGTLTFGDLNTDNIIFNADVQSSIVPDTTANYNLGSVAKQWNNLWIDGTASIDTLTVDENSQFIGYIAVGSGDIRVPSTQTTVDLFDDYATTVEAFGDATSIRIGDTTGTLTLRNPTIVGTEATQNLFNTVATQVNAFGAATTINMGVSGGGGNSNLNILSDDTVCSGDLAINGGELLSSQTTFDLLINNDNINVGNTTGQGTTTINNRLQINGNLAIGGTSTYIELPDNQTNAFRFREGSNDYLQFRTEDGLERVVVWKDLYVVGNLDISGTTTTIDSTTLLVEDKNIELGNVTTPTDATADGGGITLKATTDKTIIYHDSAVPLVTLDNVWRSNVGFQIQGLPSSVSAAGTTIKNGSISTQTPGSANAFEARLQTAPASLTSYISSSGEAYFADLVKNSGLQVTNNVTPTAGSGVEIFKPSSTEGRIQVYDRGATAFMDLSLRSDNFQVFTGGTTERLTIGTNGDTHFGGPLIEKGHFDSGGGLTGDYNHDLKTYGNVHYISTNAAGAFTYNYRIDASTTLDSVMAVGETISTSLMHATNNTSYYMTQLKIDGNNVSPVWSGGSAPSAATGSGFDVYTFSIMKVASGSFAVFGTFANHA